MTKGGKYFVIALDPITLGNEPCLCYIGVITLENENHTWEMYHSDTNEVRRES